jgi:ATP-dependent RNA helicase DDX24/MAK5
MLKRRRADADDAEMPALPGTNDSQAPEIANDAMQTFVFSATMSKDLQQNLKRRQRPKGGKSSKDKPPSTLGS